MSGEGARVGLRLGLWWWGGGEGFAQSDHEERPLDARVDHDGADDRQPDGPARGRISGEAIDHLSARMNKLPNLQSLGGAENNEKRAKLPRAWIALAFVTEAAGAEFVSKHDLGFAPGSVIEFATFFDA